MKQKVVVAMSGGVDSSLAAALLIEQGFDVIGIMLNLWVSDCQQQENSCCTPEAINQAAEVADKLKIPFYVQDAKEVFKSKVVDTFINSYQNGYTPNPCFYCNKSIKWGFLLQCAKNYGADYLATGHYARLTTDENGITHLLKSVDLKKDQSYVLSGLTQSQLSQSLFPLGMIEKTEVRKQAKARGLSIADKPDSQDLCFVDANGYRSFIMKYSFQKENPGNIRTVTGEIVGEHQGLINYTIGQRKGLGSGLGEPYYVVEIRVQENELIIGTANQLGAKVIYTDQANWILPQTPNDSLVYQVKIRYKANPVNCRIKLMEDGKFVIHLENPVRDATPGQVAVLYNQEEVVGSGIITSTKRE